MDDFYRGYIKVKGKSSLQKFKDVPASELMTLNEARQCEEYAGVIASDSILIDFDNMDESEIMMKIVESLQLNCRVLRTDRGRHFLFKNSIIEKCYTGTKLAIGLTCDIKCGKVNCYEKLKSASGERWVEWEKDDAADYDQLPKWMFPIKSKTDYTALQEGDGRNQALFNYILTLQSAGLSVEECRECITIMNAYILKEPLDDNELDKILRDEAFAAPIFFEKGRLLVEKFADYLKNNFYICSINRQLHIYQDGIYVSDYKEIERAMIRTLRGLKRNQRKETLDYLELIAEEREAADARYIAFCNGILDITTGEIGGFSPDIVITNRIPWDYDPYAYNDLTDRTLDKMVCQDRNIRLLLEECIGYCFYRRNELGVFFTLTGDRSNGKSTFIHMLHGILGDANICSLDINELGDRFSTSMLFGRLANLGDDVSDDFLKGSQVSIFKKIVTGDRIKAERKGQDPFEFNPYVKLIFSANNIPRIRDKTGAVMRRMIIVPFDARFSKTDPDFDPYIKYKLLQPKSMEYLVRIGVMGLKRVLTNNNFTQSEKVTERLKEYEAENNPIIGFIEETPLDEIMNAETEDVYRRYTVYCAEGAMQPLGKIAFVRQINKRLDLKSKVVKINNKTVRFFSK